MTTIQMIRPQTPATTIQMIRPQMPSTTIQMIMQQTPLTTIQTIRQQIPSMTTIQMIRPQMPPSGRIFKKPWSRIISFKCRSGELLNSKTPRCHNLQASGTEVSKFRIQMSSNSNVKSNWEIFFNYGGEKLDDPKYLLQEECCAKISTASHLQK